MANVGVLSLALVLSLAPLAPAWKPASASVASLDTLHADSRAFTQVKKKKCARTDPGPPGLLKDGFFPVACVKDQMLESAHAPKPGTFKVEYAEGIPTSLEYKNRAPAGAPAAAKQMEPAGPPPVAPVMSIIHYNGEVAKEDRAPMTHEVCFNFCREKPGMGYFGINAGRDCYCTPWFKAMASDSSECDATCEGNPTTMCGGMVKSSIFEMHTCGDAASSLADTLAAATKLSDSLKGLVGNATEADHSMQNGATQLAETFQNNGGDVGAGQLLQIAKGYAGTFRRSVESAQKVVAELENLAAEAQAVGEVGEDPEKIKEAEAAVDKMKTAMNAAYDEEKKLGAMMAQSFPVALAAGEGEGYYPVMYFVDKEHEADPSTCGGDVVGNPMLGDFGQCAKACDVSVAGAAGTDGSGACVGFSYFPPYGGSKHGLCFLLSKFKIATYYTGCGEAAKADDRLPEVIEGEKKSMFLQLVSRKQKRADPIMGSKCVARLQDFQGTSLSPDSNLCKSGKNTRCLKAVSEKDCIN